MDEQIGTPTPPPTIFSAETDKRIGKLATALTELIKLITEKVKKGEAP